MPRQCANCRRFLRDSWDGDECPDGVGCHGPDPWADRKRCQECHRWIPNDVEICPEGTGCRGPYRHSLPDGALEAARLARLGKADPHPFKVTGGRRKLAEPIPEGAPWWQHRAYFLRTDKAHRWSYQRIADELERPYRQVYKALNRERVAATDSRSAKRNRQELSRRDIARRKAKAPTCEKCGRRMSSQYVTTLLCFECRKAIGVTAKETVMELYRAGWKLDEIDRFMDRARGSAGAILAALRAEGVHIPHRRERADEAA